MKYGHFAKHPYLYIHTYIYICMYVIHSIPKHTREKY